MKHIDKSPKLLKQAIKEFKKTYCNKMITAMDFNSLSLFCIKKKDHQGPHTYA